MDISEYISRERLNTFREFTDNQERAIALHNHTLQLGSSIMSMIALFELALRNSTNLQISKSFGDDNWLVSGAGKVPLKGFELNAVKSSTRQAQKAIYAKMASKEKVWLDAFAFPGPMPAGISHDNRVKHRQKMLVVSHGQVIAQTSLSFWKRLYAHNYEGVLWRRSLKRVFPNKNIERSDISTALETVYAARNRVAHHEPIYGDRLEEVISSLEYLRGSLGATYKGEETTFKNFSRVQYLRLRMDHESFLEAWRTLT